MAAEEKKETKAKKAKAPKAKKPPKGKHGKLPTKRSINLVYEEKKKVNLLVAIPAILLILVLAAAFSKYLVYDRIIEMSTASGNVSRLKANLKDANELLDSFGDVENTYAHYTQEGMTAQELALVDRTRVLALVRTLLSEGNATFGPADFRERLNASHEATQSLGGEDFDPEALRETLRGFASSRRDETTVKNWSVSLDNKLIVELTGGSLEKVNKVARRLEASNIVDSVSISTANKQGNLLTEQDVTARLVIYLVKPTEEASAS